MTRAVFVIFGCWLAIVGLESTDLQADVTLRWKFTPGEKLHYAINQDLATEMQLGGQTNKVSASQTIDATWQVKTVDASGAAAISKTFDRIRAMVMVPGQPPVSYDSSAPAPTEGIAKVFSSTFSTLVNKPMTFTMRPTGDVQDFNFPPDVLAQLKQLQGPPQSGNLLSEQGLKHQLDYMAVPGEPLAAGKTWQRRWQFDTPNSGKQTVIADFTYVGPVMQGGTTLEKIDVVTTMEFTPGNQAGMKIAVKSQDNRGSILFDNDSGRVALTETRSKLSLDITVGESKMEQQAQLSSRMQLVPQP